MCTNPAAPAITKPMHPATVRVISPSTSSTPPTSSTTVTNDADTMATGMLIDSNPAVVRPMPLTTSFW